MIKIIFLSLLLTMLNITYGAQKLNAQSLPESYRTPPDPPCCGKDCYCKDCPPPPPCAGCNPGGPDVIGSFDPNDIIPPNSVGDSNWVRKDQVLPYMIRFENDPDSATAAAQIVKIYLPFFDHSDTSQFEIGDFGFGSFYITVPKGLNYFETRVDARDSVNLYVDVIAGIDIVNNRYFWELYSIDPLTDSLTTDPFAGFLPVNDTITHNGEGFVTFRIRPDTSSMTFDKLEPMANIFFDYNPPIATPMILNTIDADYPVSDVDTMIVAPDSNHLHIKWSGTDVGSGLKNYTIFIAEVDTMTGLDSTFVWQIETDSIEALLPAKLGYEYHFLSVARDSVLNVEPYDSFEFSVLFTEDILVCDSIIYVHKAASGLKLGTSWRNAYKNIHTALERARNCLEVKEIHVAQGIYTTSDSIRSVSYDLVDGVDIIGGYSANDTLPEERDFLQYPTIFSGETGTPDSTDNAYHVITAQNLVDTVIIDGITIQDGYADGLDLEDKKGAGIYTNSKLFLRNVNITKCYSQHEGTAIYNVGSGSVIHFFNCLIENNYNNSVPILINSNNAQFIWEGGNEVKWD